MPPRFNAVRVSLVAVAFFALASLVSGISIVRYGGCASKLTLVAAPIATLIMTYATLIWIRIAERWYNDARRWQQSLLDWKVQS